MDSLNAKKIARLRALLKEPRTDLRWHYRLGKCLKQFRQVRAGSTYGQRLVQTLAKQLHTSDTLLYRCLKFTRLYCATEVRELVRKGLEWHKLSLLFPIKNPNQRQQLLEAAISRRWSLRELRNKIYQRTGYRPARGGWPPIAHRSYGLEVDLRRLRFFTRQWLRFATSVWSTARNQRRDRALISPALRELLSQTRSMLNQLEEVAKQLGVRLDNLKSAVDVSFDTRGRS